MKKFQVNYSATLTSVLRKNLPKIWSCDSIVIPTDFYSEILNMYSRYICLEIRSCCADVYALSNNIRHTYRVVQA